MANPIERYFNLFYNKQETKYFGSYDMDFEPYITPEGKLKFPNRNKDKIFQTRHLKYPFEVKNVMDHLIVNKNHYYCDENGIGNRKNKTDYGKPVITTTKVGDHLVLNQWDHGLVLSPLGPDGTVKWAAVDIDLYQNKEELTRIIKQIYDEELPLVPCYSKSKGLHIYVFTKEPFTFDQIKKVLSYYVSKLNIVQKRKLELFPKQSKEPNKPGNGIALPYRSTVLRYVPNLNEDNLFKFNFHPNKNVLAKADSSLGTLEEFLEHAESCLIDETIFNDMPILEIKEQEQTPLKEETLLVPDVESSIRQPSKTAQGIIKNILEGKEHTEGGTFDNWVVDLVYCCVMIDKKSNLEIYDYFEKIKHRSDKANEPDYLRNKINNCRKKYNKADPGPAITKFFLNTVYDCEVDKYFDLEKNKHNTDKSLNQINSKLFSHKTTPAQEFYKHENKQIVDGCLYRPDIHDPKTRLIKDGNMNYINKYIPCNLEALKGSEADLKPFFDLLTYLFPNEAERNHVLNYLAFIVQNPGVKIRHAILVYSKDWQIGKGSLFDIMTDILGESNCEPGNVRSILDKGVTFSEKVLVLIDECSSTGDFKEKRNLVNDLKTIISEKRIQKRLLYVDFGAAKNFANFLIFTNNPDALTIDANDPRYFVVDHFEKRLDQKFYNKYHDWRKNNGAKFVKWYLQNRDLTKFNHNAPPPLTAAKARMAAQTQNPLLDAMQTAFDEGQMPFPFTHTIKGTSEISEYYGRFGSGKVKKFADNSKEIKRCFEKMGFHELGQVKHKLRDEKPSLWIVRNIKQLKEKKNTDLCNEYWRPISFQSNESIKQDRAIDNLYNQINSSENVQRTEQRLLKEYTPKEIAAEGRPDEENIGPNN